MKKKQIKIMANNNVSMSKLLCGIGTVICSIIAPLANTEKVDNKASKRLNETNLSIVCSAKCRCRHCRCND